MVGGGGLSMAAKTYTALTPIEHDGKPFAEGSPIKLTDEQAAPLLDLRAIELRTEAEPRKAKPAPEVASDAPAAGDGAAEQPSAE